MAQRGGGKPSGVLTVLVIDEDRYHAISTRSMLYELSYYVILCSSSTDALRFLKDHAGDVDYVLASLHMEDMNGFHFLEAAMEMHTTIQVIMMTTETTMFTMNTCVDLGARFLAKKPLDQETVSNLWQHVDKKILKMNKIKHLLAGMGVKTQDGGEPENYASESVDDGSEMRAHLMWTPFVQKKFLSALQLLGENASPKKVQTVMDVDNVGTKQVSAHLQKHRKRMEKDTAMNMFTDPSAKGATSYTSKNTHETSPNKRKYNKRADHPSKIAMVQGFFEDTEEQHLYTAMLRALQLGTLCDESQYSGDPSSQESNEAQVDATQEDGAANEDHGSNSTDDQVVDGTYDANAAQESTNKNTMFEEAVVGLVDYPDSEDLD